MAQRIFLVDDNPDALAVLRDRLEYRGYTVGTAGSAEEALSRVHDFSPSVIITDLRMPGMNGLELLERVQQGMDGVDVVVATGHEDMSSAVAAMKAGAYDYIVKPFDFQQVEDLLTRCLKSQKLVAAVPEPEEEIESFGENTVVGRDPHMIEIYKMIGVLSRNRATVLIRGETGTGKEMIARAIHDNSSAASEPFIAVNCTALSDTLLESELFGHVKGAFTGALAGRKGYFELAGAGTIFLDEIGDTSPEFQTKLLRVLQERQFYPVGGETPRRTAARVIAATHQPVERLVEEGGFREDLYFRLKVVEIQVPPLRRRRDDVSLLARTLLKRIHRDLGGEVSHITPGAMRVLEQHDWPGNVRELENVLTRASVVARGPAITEDHLSLGMRTGASAADPTDPTVPSSDTLDAVIAAHVATVLQKTGGNKSQAARVLQISRSRLARIIRKFELDDSDEDVGGDDGSDDIDFD